MAYSLTDEDKTMAQRAAQQMFAQRQPVQQDKGNLFTKSLSTIGGIGGGILGSLAGPCVGTAAGGALGAGAGKWLQNLLEGNKDLGSGVLGEAALGTIGGIGKGFSAIKGATGALKAGQGLGTAANILKMGVPKATSAIAGQGASNLLSKSASKLVSTGGDLVADTLGIKTGAKLAGKGILKPQYIDDLSNFVSKRVTGKLPNAADILVNTQNYADDIGKQISKKITGSNLKINTADVSKDIVKNLNKNLLATDDTMVKGVLDSLKNSKGAPTDIWELRKIVDDKISWIANPDAATSNMNAVAHSVRDSLNKYLNKVGLTDLNKQYGLAQDSIKLLQKPALSPSGLKIAGMNLGGDISQRATIGAGRAMEKAGSILGSAPNIPQNMAIAGSQLGARALTGSLPGAGQTAQPDMTQMMGGSPMGQSMFGMGATSGMSGMGAGQSAQPGQIYTRDAVAKDIQADLAATGGANMDKYIKLYEFLNQSGSESEKYNSTVSGTLSDFQSSLNELNKLGSSIESGSGSVDPIVGTLRSFNPYDTEQQTLRAAIDKTRQIVGKALEGGVLRKEDEEKYKKILPTTSDTRAVAIAKIAMIRSQLESKMQDYSSLVSGGYSAEDMLGSQGLY